MERSDEALVRAARAGDEAAFAALYGRYSRRLYGYLLHLVRDSALAEDILQEVFLTVVVHSRYEARPGRLGGFLFRAARNRGLTAIRDAGRRAKKLEHAAGEASDATLEARTADRDALERALSGLAEHDRDALILKAVGGLTYREIAEEQEVPEGTVKSRLHGAVRALRLQIEGAGS